MSFSNLARCALAFVTLAPLSAATLQEPPTAAPKAIDAETAIARLVPNDAVCIVKITSLDALATTIRSAVHAAAPETTDAPELDKLLSEQLQFPGRIELIDHKKPLAVCISLDLEHFRPVPTFILPVTSRDEFLKSLPQPDETPSPDGMPKPPATAKPAGLGDYVGYTELEKYAAAEAPRSIAASLLPGTLSARIDLERVFEVTRPMIDPYLEQAEEAMASAPSSAAVPGLDAKALAQTYVDGFRKFMDSAETLDIAASMQGDRVETALSFTALEKSPLADFGSKEKTGVESLAKCLDPDAAFSFLIGADMAAMMKRFQPFLDGMMALYPEPVRANWSTSMATFSQIYALLGSGFAMSGDVGPTGLRGAAYFHPKDSKALLEQYTKTFKEMKFPGVVVHGLEPVTIDGVALSQLQITVDAKALTEMMGDKVDPTAGTQVEAMMKKIYGANGLRVAYGVKDDKMVQVIGGDDAYLRRSVSALSDSGRKLPRETQVLVDRVSSSNPCFVAQIDIARYFATVMELVVPDSREDKSEAKAKTPPSAPVVVYGGIDGRIWHGGASWDMARVAKGLKDVFESAGVGEKNVAVAHSGKAMADIMAIDSAIREYAIMNGGKYPETLLALVTPDSNDHTYLESKKVPLDPWGREYLYDFPSPGHPEPRVYSYGKDGKPGGEGDDADIDSMKFREKMKPEGK